eukprot:scpid73400/ scgid33060/ 
MALVQMLVSFVIMASLCLNMLTGTVESVEAVPHSCMHFSLVAAGIDPWMTFNYEHRLAKNHWTENQILNAPDRMVAKVLESTVAVARGVKKCLKRRTPECYLAKCQNGGTCEPDSTMWYHYYTCKCPALYSGGLCEKKNSKAVEELKQLQSTVDKQKETIKTLDHTLTSHGWSIRTLQARVDFAERFFQPLLSSALSHLQSCSRQYLGYQYKSKFNTTNVGQNGTVTQMTFKKKQAKTALRISYSTSLHIHVPAGQIITRWYFQIDGYDCKVPDKIEMVLHQPGSSADLNIPILIEGVCEETTNGALGKGNREIALYGEVPENQVSTPVVQYPSTSLFQVQELCK